MRAKYTIDLPNREPLELGERTLIVGVVNVTPDSFSDGGEFLDPSRAIERAIQMEAEGADIIEIGGESTRPGAAKVDAVTELGRILPVVEGLFGKLKAPISVDTYKASVAEAVLANGASIINDVSALRFDSGLAGVVGTAKAGLVLMHMRGDPSSMQKLPPSPDIMGEIESDLRLAIDRAIASGVDPRLIIIDPGIGFGKTLEQNLEIINRVARFSTAFGLPVMIGTSRKSSIGRLTGREKQNRMFGTAASVAIAIVRGAHMVRVHDVREMADVVRVADALARAE
ncbi:MAG TPA: dihydropteroate synthase [Blastocatellia bacterium]